LQSEGDEGDYVGNQEGRQSKDWTLECCGTMHNTSGNKAVSTIPQKIKSYLKLRENL
jgi:hypothetical protein